MKTVMTLALMSLLAVACDKQERIANERSEALEERQESVSEARQQEEEAIEEARKERLESVKKARAEFDRENNELQREEAVELIEEGKDVDIRRDGDSSKIRVEE